MSHANPLKSSPSVTSAAPPPPASPSATPLGRAYESFDPDRSFAKSLRKTANDFRLSAARLLVGIVQSFNRNKPRMIKAVANLAGFAAKAAALAFTFLGASVAVGAITHAIYFPFIPLGPVVGLLVIANPVLVACIAVPLTYAAYKLGIHKPFGAIGYKLGQIASTLVLKGPLAAAKLTRKAVVDAQQQILDAVQGLHVAFDRFVSVLSGKPLVSFADAHDLEEEEEERRDEGLSTAAARSYKEARSPSLFPSGGVQQQPIDCVRARTDSGTALDVFIMDQGPQLAVRADSNEAAELHKQLSSLKCAAV